MLKYNTLTDVYMPAFEEFLYMEGHVQTHDKTNIPGDTLKNLMMMPLSAPEVKKRFKSTEVENGNMDILMDIKFPISCLFPSLLVYLIIFCGYFIKSEIYKVVWFVILITIPFY